MRKFFLLAPLAALVFVACEQQAAEQAATEEPVVDVAAEEQAVRALADSYEQSFAAKDPEALVGYYTPDAVWTAHDGTRTEGADGFRAQYTTMFASPGTATIEIEPETVVVAASGDVGYSTGTGTVTVTTTDGQTMSQTTAHIVTFAKGDDGQWRLTGGMDTAPLAASPGAEAETAPAE